MKITRRKLALVLAAPAGLAQTPPAQIQTAADPLEAAKDRIKANGDALSKESVPMATEPAFQFKA
jgi:hypothetical protein